MSRTPHLCVTLLVLVMASLWAGAARADKTPARWCTLGHRLKQVLFAGRLMLSRTFWAQRTTGDMLSLSSCRRLPQRSHPRPWPDAESTRGIELRPTRGAFAYNEILIDAPAERVFSRLLDLHAWRGYYANAAVHKAASVPRLQALGDAFEWVTFAARQRSRVGDFASSADAHVIGWDAVGEGTYGFHRFIIAPAGNRTRVVTEEVQTGPLTRIAGGFVGRLLRSGHERWLRGLKSASESAP